jgi:SulP family sulfate permease
MAPNLLAGFLCALMTLAYASSFASLIFGGALAPVASMGVMISLVGSCTALLALSWMSSFPFALGGPDSNPSAILSISVATIAADIIATEGPGGSALLPTVFMFLFVSAFLCGLLLYLVGRRKWGRYVRYIPHPVVGGFLAGTGFLLVAGAWKMLFGHGFLATTAEDLAGVSPLAWGLAVAVALTLIVALRYSRHFLVIPGVIIAAVVVFHAVRAGCGLTMTEAREAGLLLAPLSPGEWHHPLAEPWSLVRWDLILAHGNDFAAMSMVVLVTILLNANSLDLATGRDADFDRELKALGVANVASGLFGGLVAVNSFNRSLLNYRAGATSPWSARICAAIVLGITLLAPGAVAVLPRPVLTGLVLYLGLSLLINWLWDARRELPTADYLTVVAILGMVALLGIVPGVVLGIILASLSFVVSFSRNSVVRQRFTAATRRSNVERMPADQAWLSANGDRLQGYVLSGHLFFGTASSLLDEIREALGRANAEFLVVDFWQVRGLDASAVIVMRKLVRLTDQLKVGLVFTGLGERLEARLRACGLPPEKTNATLFADLDRGLEWAEEQLLTGARPKVTLGEALGIHADAEAKHRVEEYFAELVVPAGAALFVKGTPSDSMFLLLAGRVSVHLRMGEGNFSKRLRSYGPGTIVGEMGFYDRAPRSADVTADMNSRLARVDVESLARLERESPELAAQIHRFVIGTLAARLRSSNDEMRHLL